MEEREHPATERQRARFAERGQIASSRDLTGAGAVVGCGLLLAIFGATAMAATTTCVATLLGGLGTLRLAQVGQLFLLGFARAAVPALLGAASGALLLGLVQGQGHVSTKALEIDWSRLDPWSRLQQMFGSTDSLISLLTAVVKVSVVAAVCGVTLFQKVPALLHQHPASLGGVGKCGGDLVLTLFVRAAVTLVALGLADWALVWFRLERRMRMTTQELRDDFKEELGDPLIRQQRRRRQRELLRQRSQRDVGRSTVVLVNPTHFAVAIMYVAERMDAPRVVAKGADFAAERIRSTARQAGVPIISNPPLTRLLYRRVRVGAEIPADLYQAVAVVLAYVYRVRKEVA